MRPPIRPVMTRFTLNGSPGMSACCADTPRNAGLTARIAAPDPYRSDGSGASCVACPGSSTITTGAHRAYHNRRFRWVSTTWSTRHARHSTARRTRLRTRWTRPPTRSSRTPTTTWTPRSTRSSTRPRTSSRRRRSADRGRAPGSGSGEGGQPQGNGPVEQQLALGGRQRRVPEQQVGDGADGERLLALQVRDRVEAGGLHLHGERAVLDQRLHGGGPVGVEDVRGQHGADLDVPVLATTTPPRAAVVGLASRRYGLTGPDARSLRRRCGQGEGRRVAVVDAGDSAGAGRGVG